MEGARPDVGASVVNDIDVGMEFIWPHSVGDKVGPVVPKEAGMLVGSLTGDEEVFGSFTGDREVFCSTEGATVNGALAVGAAENALDDGELDLTPDVTGDGELDPTTVGALLERNTAGLLVATKVKEGRLEPLGPNAGVGSEVT